VAVRALTYKDQTGGRADGSDHGCDHDARGWGVGGGRRERGSCCQRRRGQTQRLGSAPL